MDDTNNINPHENEIESEESAIESDLDTSDTDAQESKWYSLNSQKKKVAAGVGAGALAFVLGFGAAALVVDGGHDRHDGRRFDMQQQADGQRMSQHGDWRSQPFDSHRGGPQGGQQGGPQWNGQQMPQQGQMPSAGPNSGTPSQSHGS